ncbi:kinase-like domain-containing protein [Aspergillus granulosus]|uniref:Kinase-like domain-containing protein n=1 Tax=Aspergillus granulosus TaxID=176169 RepID=A0ABR4HW80_9EURO
MDWDERAEASHYAESLSWASRFNSTRGPPIATWVSTFRNNQPSEVVGDNCGSFNWSCRVKFDDGIQWMVRFAVSGRVMDDDEKISHEAATMRFVKEKTNIPVPSIIAWGSGDENPLGLGAFIIMEFIEGEPLDMILRQGPGREEAHTLRLDIGDEALETIYRQIANILLELSAHNFPRIGSLSRNTDFSSGINSRPLTLKMNEIKSHGGVCVGGHVSKTFSSATSYFQHVAEQDMQHLCGQPNSVDDTEDARRKYLHNKIFTTIVPHFVDSKYDHGPFKLICDDFRFGNILVNNAQDLKIVAVLDWEWAYAAPFQMLYSPPRWLLLKKPFDWDDMDASKYKSLLKMFINVLEEEQQKRAESRSMPSMATLMHESMEDGRFWFHELIYSCFKSPESRAWIAIRKILPSIDELATAPGTEVELFVDSKMEQLNQYNVEWAAMKEEIDKKEADFQALKERVEEDGCSLESPNH